MRREIIIAIIAGLLIGLVVAFGAWRFNSQKSEINKIPEVISQADETEALNISAPTGDLSFTTVEDFDVITVSPYKISGIGKPNSKLAISTENKNYFVTTEEDGAFNAEIDLKSGLNQILFANHDGVNTKKTNLTLIYASDLASLLETPPTNNESTDEGETVLDKVRQQVENIRKNPKAILGSVTDKTENTLQVKNLSGKIELISVAEDSTFTKTGTSNTSIKFSDIGIGDFVVVLGFGNGNSVFNARKILLTDPLVESKRTIAIGKVTSISKKEISVKNEDDEEVKFTWPKKWIGPDIDEIETDILVAIVADDSQVQTIEILSEE